jgi:hypothetical protein
MTSEMAPSDRKHLDRLMILVWSAVTAGLLVLVLDPDAGSTNEAVLAIAAFIDAHVKNLWGFVPTPIRALLWVLISVGMATSLWKLISQLFN